MADAIFVKIASYLTEEASKVIGVKEDLEGLKRNLTCIEGYLKEDEARGREDEVSKRWTIMVLEIAYDIEDVLDTYILRVEERSQKQRWVRWANQKSDDYNIVDKIKKLKGRISDATNMRGTYAVGNVIEQQDGASTSSSRMRETRRVPSLEPVESIVGFDDDAKILSAEILSKDSKRSVISIYGMGGQGKTSLVRKLYNSRDVKNDFPYRGWTYVSQKYKTKDILERIIRSFGVPYRVQLGVDGLENYISSFLKEKRYLLVIDDVWETQVLVRLLRILPHNGLGSRVIITTRKRAVAIDKGEGMVTYAHSLGFLNPQESLKLFEQNARMSMERADKYQQETGNIMLQKCGGLPFAIVVLGMILSRKRPGEWNDVCNSLWRHLYANSIPFTSVFDLSFKELRHELKFCFLYLSVFPENYTINVHKLICLLVAEGLIKEDNEMMEDVAQRYIDELIDRRFLKTESTERGNVTSCKVHDLMRNKAIEKAKELNFVHVYNNQCAQNSSITCRREVVHNLTREINLCNRTVDKGMRSSYFFGESEDCETTFFLKRKLLRVLHIGRIQFVCEEGKKSLPYGIGDLILLKYIRIVDTSLLAFISNFRRLQTLDAWDIDSFKEEIDLRKLTSLRHVLGKFVGDFLIGEAVNLQTLRSISSYSWSKLKHEQLINLRDLKIYDESTWVDQKKVDLDLASFFNLRYLRVLKLDVKAFSLSSETPVVFRNLVRLILYCDIKSLPKNMEVIFPVLESLILVRSNLKEDPMPTLKKLQRLEQLVMQFWHFPGGKMNINAQGFGQLKKLELNVLNVSLLQIEDKAMPKLYHLILKKGRRQRQIKMIVPDRVRAFVRSS